MPLAKDTKPFRIILSIQSRFRGKIPPLRRAESRRRPMSLFESLRNLIALGREVICSGELETNPPGDRHLEDFLDAFEAFRRQARIEAFARSDDLRILSGVVVDLNNYGCGLRACREIARWSDRSGDSSESATGAWDDLRVAFESAQACLEELECLLRGEGVREWEFRSRPALRVASN